MKKILFVASLFAFSTFAGSWKGTISDEKCAAKHTDASEKSIGQRMCLKSVIGHRFHTPERASDVPASRAGLKE